jgi:rare lipoprotein A (peptidoglycan hydrolase)
MLRLKKKNITIFILLLIVSPTIIQAHEKPYSQDKRHWHETKASWYDYTPKYCYDKEGRHRVPRLQEWTAHKTLPCGTNVRIARGSRRLTLQIWDRGPYVRGRNLDLSKAAFKKLDHLSKGVIKVDWRVCGCGTRKS